MESRIFGVKTRYALLLSLALGLTAAGPALAACDVTLSSILPNGQVVLKANCGTGTPVTGISWFQDGNSLTGGIDLPLNPTVTGTDIYYTVPLIFSNTAVPVRSYTATGNGGTLSAGTPVTIAIAPPALNVSASTGGMVVSTPAGINNCRNATGTCLATYAPGATVSLAATADSGFVFSGWGGDCSGTALCTVGMTSVRTVAATFGPVPTPGACGTANNVASASSPSAANLCNPGTASNPIAGSNTWSWSWTCTGPNGGSTASCSAPQIVAGVCGSASSTTALNAPPTGTAACATGIVANMAANTNTFTWNCTGINGGQNAPTTCSAPIQSTPGVCGSANGINVASAPTGPAACSAGVSTTPTNPSNTYSWTCTGLANGASQSCTAYQIVNGACGSSNGQSFSSAPTGNLCSAGNATGVTGAGPFNWSCTGINTGTTASCSASLTTTSGCSTVGDLEWPIEQALYPVASPGLQASGDAGTAIRFVSNSGAYPLGMIVSIVDQASQPSSKEAVISSCARDFTPPQQATCRIVAGGTGTLVVRFGQGSVTALNGDCALQPNQTYFLNLRQWKPSGDTSPRGTIATQFWWQRRSDP